jgi:predicted HicB family RNase H-like nuclease
MPSKQVLHPMQIRIPDSVRNWLKSQARSEERSMNWIINKVLEQAQKQEAQHG